MKKFIYVFSYLLLINCIVNAQQQKGQIVINAGVGYSPIFDGSIVIISSTIYPIKTNYENHGIHLTIPNLGMCVDYFFSNGFSFGLAANYQSENINYDYYVLGDEVTRINFAGRLIGHINPSNPHVDNYIGVRIGCSYWHDIPLQNNIIFIPPPYLRASFQVLYGIRLYIFKNVGIHAELGIGSPYFAEAGLTFRINAGGKNTQT